MRRISLLLNLVALFLVVTPALAARITTPALIDDNMVLRRNSVAKIWGWASAGERIAVTADWAKGDTVWVSCDHNSRFEASIKTPEAGGPYTVKIKGDSDERILKSVLIGEVWLCSGQSNMQMSIGTTYGTVVDYHEEFAGIDNPRIRTFVTPRIGADSPQMDCKGQWDECNSKTISDVSLTAYFFAEKLERELGIPVGIVVSAWGGTNAEVWMDDDTRRNSDVDKSAAYMEAQRWKPIATSALYNSMIAPLVPFNFSGAIWYQGESNIPCYRYYDSVMRTLIDSWREDFGRRLPFYYVQIAPFTYNGGSKGRSAYLREQQTATASHRNCGMVVVNDLVDDVANIHPKNKRDVGARLADMALSYDYGRVDIDCSYPEVESVECSGDKLLLRIKGCDKGLSLVRGKSSGFMIAPESGNFVAATAKVGSDNTITLSAKGIKDPIYVRYLFDDESVCGVKGGNGLPMIPYRNDKF